MTEYLQFRTIYTSLIPSAPSPNLNMVVVIPAYDEEFLLLSLMSLKKCSLPNGDVEIIVVINDAENESPQVVERHKKIWEIAQKWAVQNSLPRLRFHILYFNGLPKKHAGVGLARKIGMDEACWRFEKIGNPKGIIACFDADSRCEPNYFEALEWHFEAHAKSPACSIYFEHPLAGADFEPAVYQAITQYELHLRYFINAQRWSGFPFAFQTVGSSMAVRCRDYQLQGGMNRRQAGEDFYFLHKFIELGNFTELTATKVIPSPRASHRVPFGTGRAVDNFIRKKDEIMTYAPESFLLLKQFFNLSEQLFAKGVKELNSLVEEMPPPLATFLHQADFLTKVLEIQQHTNSRKTFSARFFKWFDAFLLMKYLHFCRDQFYPNVPVSNASEWLFKELGLWQDCMDERQQLLAWRALDRKGWKMEI